MNIPHVVYVDDEESILWLVESQLKGYIRSKKITFSSHLNGVECAEFLKNNMPNLEVLFVVSDINMPKMDGLELLTHIKSMYPKVQVYMASAYGSNDYIDKAKSLGATDFFVKPINMDNITKLIDEFLLENN